MCRWGSGLTAVHELACGPASYYRKGKALCAKWFTAAATHVGSAGTSLLPNLSRCMFWSAGELGVLLSGLSAASGRWLQAPAVCA